jgi:hypothetical protein
VTTLIALQRYSSGFERTASWPAHEGIILASIVALTSSRSFDLVTCGSDEQLKVTSLVALRLVRFLF